MEGLEWRFSRTFCIDEKLASQTELVCDGLDLTAKIWINGKKAGSSNNMFVQSRFLISDLLKPGENEILVTIDDGLNGVQGKDLEKFASSWNHYELKRPWLRKAQQCFGWDVAPRLSTCGIWRDIYIESFDAATIRDVYVTSESETNKAFVTGAIEIEAFSDMDFILQFEISDNESCGITEQAISVKKGRHSYKLQTALDSPKLWWPNGLGEPHLYNVSARLLSGQGKLLDIRRFKHGIRTIEIEQQALNAEETTFTFLVNGVKVFCKGGNWVPSDCLYARINREKEYTLLKYAKDANCNMLRVWGGGVYPDTFFYEACDELGIMVWQDFMYACGYYPDDEADFMANAADEAEKIVRKFRNHAALALWCANNECQWMHAQLKNEFPLAGKRLYDEMLPEVCKKLAPKTYYHPGSPYPINTRAKYKKGDQHVWEYTLGWHQARHKPVEERDPRQVNPWRYTENNHKFVSEFGFFGPCNLSSVRKFMGVNPVKPDTEVYNFHRNYFEGDYINELLRRNYKAQGVESFEEFTVAGQMLQGEVLKFILEEFRSRMYVCSGTLFWEYNDTWPHIGYAPIDYFLSVKPVYYYMKKGFSPLHTILKNKGRVLYVINDYRADKDIDLEYGCMGFDGKVLFSRRKNVSAKAGACVQVDDMTAELEALAEKNAAFAFTRLYRKGMLVEKNREFLVDIKDVRMPKDTMKYRLEKIGDGEWGVTFTAEQFVWMAVMDSDDDVIYSDNAFDLWPGEQKRVILKCAKLPELEIRNVNMFMHKV
jgi:beta-mannosidase